MIHVSESERIRIIDSFTNQTPQDIASVVEELAELTQVLTKYLRHHQARNHPMGFSKWRETLVEEFGDTMVVLTWLQWKFMLTDGELHKRIETVIDRYGG